MPAAPPTNAPTIARRSWILLVVLAAAGLDGLACSLRHAVRPAPLPAAASVAFDRARELLERPAESDPAEAEHRAAARAAAEEALTLAPSWVAPRRLLDDLARDELVVSEALAEHLEALALHPDDPALLYLVGRLEGRAGEERFRRARERDPNLAWAQHGLGWMRFLAGDARAALRYGQAATARAREPWERLYFTTTQARYLLRLDRAEDAAELLAPLLEPDAGLRLADRRRAALWLARTETSSRDDEVLRRGYRRGLALLASGALPEEELAAFTAELQLAGARLLSDGASAIEDALARSSSTARDALRAQLAFQRGAPELASALLRRDPRGRRDLATLADPVELRAAALAEGDAEATLEAWLAALPQVAVADDGLPREPSLRALLLAARAGTPEDLGAALLTAGWFEEALGFARHLAQRDPTAALDLERQALAARAFLDGLRDLLQRVDRGDEVGGGWLAASRDPLAPAAGKDADGRGGLAGLLDAVAALAGRELAPKALADRSPRLSFGPFAEVVHPGPTFSAEDERAGRGQRGGPVPGLAAMFARLGRFALFGKALGDAPDGTVLRRLVVEQRAGEHLGVAYAGTVVWCEGADVPSRPGRSGAQISGAALHEGYWVDVQGPRRDAERWARLAERFPADAPHTRAVLAAAGPRTELAGVGPAAVYAPDGLADRLRLAVLAERAAAHPELHPDELVPFEELLAVTALHEEGHLCDRARFLPLGTRFWAALSLLRRAGFTPVGIARRLEYRAQLTAVATAADPRVPLAECLDALGQGPSFTAHAAAYELLVRDLLQRLEERRDEFAALDEERLLLHQLHRLGAEELRSLARAQARRLGMLEGD